MSRKIWWTFIVITVGVGAFFIGKFNGANLVRNGIVANYPNFKSLITNAVIEKDSTVTFYLVNKKHADFFALLKHPTADTIWMSVPYHAVYGTDLNSKFYKIGQEGNQLEALMPKPYLRSVVVGFDEVKANGKNLFDTYGREVCNQAKPMINEMMYKPLNKDKIALENARRNITERVMWLFIPYKFDLKIYFANQQYELPEIVGLNKDVDAFLKQSFNQDKK